MDTNGFTIWCNAPVGQTGKDMLRDGIGGNRLLFADRENIIPEEADIAFGQPNASQAMQRGRLRWVHLSSAGYTAYDHDEVRKVFRERGSALTTSSDVYAEPVAQHALAMMLALARRLPQSLDTQRGDRSWTFLQTRADSRLLNGQTVVLLGYGAIALRLIELLAPFQTKIIAVRRNVKGDEIVRALPESEVDDLLPLADHVVNILPASPSTGNFLNAERLRLIKPGAYLYNVGRGTTIDQEALRENLLSGHLAAAYLDVMEPEPLPPDHPLWTTPHCFITPHSAGGHANESERLAQHFIANLRRYENGERLVNQVI